MSGGSFNYAYSTATWFADELRERLQDAREDDPGWSVDVVAKLSEIADLVERAGELMKAAEWLCSGDFSEATFMSRVREIEGSERV